MAALNNNFLKGQVQSLNKEPLNFDKTKLCVQFAGMVAKLVANPKFAGSAPALTNSQ